MIIKEVSLILFVDIWVKGLCKDMREGAKSFWESKRVLLYS